MQLRRALSLLPTARYSSRPRFEFVEIAEHLGQPRTPSRFYRLPCMSLQLCPYSSKTKNKGRHREARDTAKPETPRSPTLRNGGFRPDYLAHAQYPLKINTLHGSRRTQWTSLLPAALYSIAPRFEFVEIAEHLGQLRTPSRFYRLPCMSLQLNNQKQRQTPRSRMSLQLNNQKQRQTPRSRMSLQLKNQKQRQTPRSRRGRHREAAGNATGRGEQWQVPQGEQYEIA